MNILLLSSIYPIPSSDSHGTKVCHFFAQEWLKMGHNVRVVHYQAVYPKPFYWAAKMMRSFLAAKTGAVIYTIRDKEVLRYKMDNVPILKIPLYKPLPHGKFSGKGLDNSIECILQDNKSNEFVPDLIVGHFINPQLEVLSVLKKHYPASKTSLIYHLPAEIKMAKDVYGKKLAGMLSTIDVFGFRNEYIRKLFQAEMGSKLKSFICYSGVPENYLTNENKHNFEGDLKDFVYVGELIERKYPLQVLEALMKTYYSGDFNLCYVGDGQLKSSLTQKISHYKLQNKVSLLGRIPRDEIKTQYDKSQCMIMISKGEAYGLVYLEAMARGCITIASRNEGFDGVIIDGYNGFLCEAGNSSELALVIDKINKLNPEDRLKISNNAIDTARSLTDHLAAKRYLDDILAKC